MTKIAPQKPRKGTKSRPQIAQILFPSMILTAFSVPSVISVAKSFFVRFRVFRGSLFVICIWSFGFL
jgi:hypothetical protein